MKTIYFIRHGETEANVGANYLGEKDPLTEHGRQQARFIAKRCAKLPLQALIVSTMMRTQDTAGYIAEETGLRIESSDLFVERLTPTALIGRSNTEPDARDIFDRWTESFISENAPRVLDGENFTDIVARVDKALAYLKERQESHIAVVTHGFFLRVLAARIIFGRQLLPGELKRFLIGLRTSNTGITVVEDAPTNDLWAPWMGEQEWIIRVWNDRAHLG